MRTLRAMMLALAVACIGIDGKDKADTSLDTGTPPSVTTPPTLCDPGEFGASTFGDACFQ